MVAMRRVRFSGEDLARTRVVPTVGKVGETLFALELLTRGAGGAPFKQWRTSVRGRLSRSAQSLTTIAQCVRPFPDLAQLVGDDAVLTRAADGGAEGHRVRVAAAVRDFYRAALAPYWGRVHDHLETEREVRGRVVLSGGIGLLLGTLHPRVVWDPPHLLVPGVGDVDLNGRGLLLAPSLFLTGGPRLLPHGTRGGAAPLLVYPVPLNPIAVSVLWDQAEDTGGGPALGALVGRTRAEMLRALADTCTSSELGRRLGISSAAVSQHTSVLRRSGLIASQRRANTMSHSITPLGVTLLKGRLVVPSDDAVARAGRALLDLDLDLARDPRAESMSREIDSSR
jgi:DNA-binding transcriptional ArsR family regulator